MLNEPSLRNDVKEHGYKSSIMIELFGDIDMESMKETKYELLAKAVYDIKVELCKYLNGGRRLQLYKVWQDYESLQEIIKLLNIKTDKPVSFSWIATVLKRRLENETN